MTFAVAHLIPSSVFANTWQGSYKDTISRVRFLESAGIDYRQIRLDCDDPLLLRGVLKDFGPCRFLMEYTTLPRTLEWIRRERPESFIAVRSHNIEPLQHLDNHGWWSRKGPLWVGYGMLRLLQADLAAKRMADVVYSISDWETRSYWHRLPGGARVEWLPYLCPEHLLPQTPVPVSNRRRIVCLPASRKNRKSWDLVTRFMRFSEKLSSVAPGEFEFFVTGNVADWGLPRSDAVTFSGMVEDLRDFLSGALAVCLLSPLGYGFKTTLGDALAHGCRAILHPRLARRCPEVIRRWVISVDSRRDADLLHAAGALREPPAPGGVDRMLTTINHNLLTRDFVHAAIAREAFVGNEAKGAAAPA